MKRNDDERESPDDARFVERLEALYRPPAETAADRGRFAARLEARIARGRGRRPWLLAGTLATATAALVLALLPDGESEVRGTDAPVSVTAEEASSPEEALLLLANGPLADPDEALPDDYQTLASLLE